MICVASSKHRSMRLARMWNSRSPGVETAWRAAGANLPERMQFRRPRRAEQAVPRLGAKPHDAGQAALRCREIPPRATARQGRRRTTARSRDCPSPGLTVTTRKIAARVSGADTGCATARTTPAASGAVIGSDSIDGIPWRVRGISLQRPRSRRVRTLAGRVSSPADDRPCRRASSAETDRCPALRPPETSIFQTNRRGGPCTLHQKRYFLLDITMRRRLVAGRPKVARCSLFGGYT